MMEGLVKKGWQIKRKCIPWKTIRLSGLLTTEEMLYVLNEKNATKPRSLKRSHLVARFKRRFRNHFLSSYLQYKSNVLFESHSHLKTKREYTLEALLLLDYYYIASAKKVDCSR
jgi:hypothetical protein